MQTTLRFATALIVILKISALESTSFALSPGEGASYHATRTKSHRVLVPADETGSNSPIVASDRAGSSDLRYENAASRGQAIARTALEFRGLPYRFGGNSLTKGIDCSAFVRAIYSQFGIALPRVASQQFLHGVSLEKENLMPGDLVFFQDTYKAGISHVGLYVGGGSFVHASGKAKGVCVSSLQEDKYLKHWAGARRLDGSADYLPPREERQILEEMNTIMSIPEGSGGESSSDSEASAPAEHPRNKVKSRIVNEFEKYDEVHSEAKVKNIRARHSARRKTVKKKVDSRPVIEISDIGSAEEIGIVASETDTDATNGFEAFERRRASRKKALLR